MRNPFRLGIAHGDAFCNRAREKAQLTQNMHSGIHTVLISSTFLLLLLIIKNVCCVRAKLHPAEIHSQAFLKAGRLGSQGGVQASLAKLKKLDLVEQRGGVWRVVDPVFEKWLAT